MAFFIFLYALQFCFFIHVYSIRIQVIPEVLVRSWPYNGNSNFSKDWSDECDVPCVWTGKADKADGVFYIIRNNEDANWAFQDKKVAPISIGATTEGAHYYSLLTISTFEKYFTASSFIDLRSDIPWVLKVSSYEDMQSVPQVQNPIKKALTAIFNCGSKNNRETIVMEMSKIVPIDSIGNCLRNAPWPICGDQACKKDEVLKRYMFCLVFENGVSPGFVSEKIHQCFRAGSLPIWYGTEDVALLVPKGSYVDMRDFESHSALAEYMVKLTNNETLYNSYFEWKKRPLDPDYVRRNKPFWEYKVQCRVCRYVWVKQRGFTWDRVTQNATVILNASPDTKQLSLTLDKVTQNTQSNLNASNTKHLSLTLDNVIQNTQDNLNASPDTKQFNLTLDNTTHNSSEVLPSLEMVAQNNSINLNDLSVDPGYVNDEIVSLLLLSIHDENMANSTKYGIIILVFFFVLFILIAYIPQLLRFRNYFVFRLFRNR